MKEIVETIIRQMKKYGINANAGALEKDICALQEKMNIEFPNDYVELLTLVNGLEFNGAILYSIDDSSLIQKVSGIYYMNKTWREMGCISESNLLVWAEDDMNLYVYDFKTNKYKTIGKYGNDVFQESGSILDQLLAILNLIM